MKGRLLPFNCLKAASIFVFLWLSFSLSAQKEITIFNEIGEPLIGVECYNKDFSFTLISDHSGTITVPEEFSSDTIFLKYLGFKISLLDLDTVGKISQIKLIQEENILEEIILVGRNDLNRRDLVQQVDAISSSSIAAMNAQSTVDALSQNSNVFVQKSQMGGGSPVIRGFEANRVLLVVDGVRMNNAIYRNGHLQNAITVDESILNRMEIIYGPSSLMYGSDALGGVIHFRTIDPKLNLSEYKKTSFDGNYALRYSSANNEKTANVNFNIGRKKWAFLSSFSFSDFDDLRMGNRRTSEYPDYGKLTNYPKRINGEDQLLRNSNPNIQIGTGYSQFDLLQKLRYQINEHMNIDANIQYSTSSDIPRFDQLSLRDENNLNPQFAEWYYGPQDRFLASLKYKWTQEVDLWDELILISSFQDIQESRITRNFNSNFRESRIEDVYVLGLTLDARKKWERNWNHHLFYGLDYNHNIVESSAFRENIANGTVDSNLFTRYPSGGSRANNFGTYVQMIHSSPDSVLNIHMGLRYSYFNTDILFNPSDPIQWPSYFYDGIFSVNDAFTWSAGINLNPGKAWTINLLASTAFRSPNVDDIGKLRVKADNMTVPNPDLGAERSLNFEANIQKSFKKFADINFTGFYTSLDDVIMRTGFMLPNGDRFYQIEDRSYTIEGNINAEKARIYGISVNLNLRVTKELDLRSSYNFLRGQVLDDQSTSLAHIPPAYGSNMISYSREKWSLRLSNLFNGFKAIEEYGGSTDNPEYATPEGSLPWSVYNVYFDYRWRSFTYQIGIENIFDKHYLPFSSGVSAPGFNLILAFRGKF